MDPTQEQIWGLSLSSKEEEKRDSLHPIVFLTCLPTNWTSFEDQDMCAKLHEYFGPRDILSMSHPIMGTLQEPFMLLENKAVNHLRLTNSSTSLKFCFLLNPINCPPWTGSGVEPVGGSASSVPSRPETPAAYGALRHLLLIHKTKMALLLTMSQVLSKETSRPLSAYEGRTWALTNLLILCPQDKKKKPQKRKPQKSSGVSHP
jgi:hypothetical protein